MTDRQATSDYLTKAAESLAGAASELANRRYNNCANRCYYACFQAAIAALLAAGIPARSRGGHINHEYIQAQFAGQLINRRKRYPSSLRRVLADNMLMRHAADYDPDSISEIQAHRALRWSREFVNAVEQQDGTIMIEQHLPRSIDPRIRAAMDELEGMILARYPETTFDEGEPDDRGVVYVRAIVDVDDPGDVTEVFIDRMIDLLVDDGLAIYVVPVRTPERSAAEWKRQRSDPMRFA